MSMATVVSVSGGKDSTATALIAAERAPESLVYVFADTGHEHPLTYEYLDYLDGVLRERAGVGITWVRADFAERLRKRAVRLPQTWGGEVSPERIERAQQCLQPTGIPFLDLCLLKGRFPSTRARFCSQELKHAPIQEQVIDPLMQRYEAVASLQGVRADESLSRSRLPRYDVEFGSWEPSPSGLLIERPIIDYTAHDVFTLHRRHGVRWNPLYERGMGRVGCMPCIHARKSELREIARRYPEEIARVREWERLVSEGSKRGASTFFAADKTGASREIEDISPESHGIDMVVEWSCTTRGGKQRDLLADTEPVPECQSVYGLCE